MPGTFSESENIVWQTRRRTQTPYEDALAGALETVLGEGVHELDEIVARLNALGVRTETGESWTGENFPVEMKRLGV